jgi:hypothetical protein
MQCHQNSNDIHYWKINPKIHLEAQKTENSHGNTEQKEQCWRYHNTQLQTISQRLKTSWYWCKNRYEDQWKQNGSPRYESTHLCPPEFWQNHPKHAIENRQPFQQILLGKLNICMQKTERSMSFTLYKYQPIRPKTLKLV